MNLIARLLLLVGGLGIVALLVLRAGPALLLDMLTRVGWIVPAVSAVYALHQMVRAAALWRSVPAGPVRYADVLRIRISGEAVESLTFTGPFLAEPAKGWWLKRRGVPTADAFATIAIEYLLYTVVAAWMAIVALTLLLAHASLPPAVRPGAVTVLVTMVAFNVAFAFAAITGIGLIAPVVRASRALVGASRAAIVAGQIGQVERVLVAFLHARPGRVAEVLAIEAAAHALLVSEVWIVIAALGVPVFWSSALIVEGGVKCVSIAFFFVPGQIGASEGAYALLLPAIGFPAAAGLTVALVRRVRGLLVAGAGVIALARFDDW
ncbi:MAG: flippase-like domain-containing protein [Acidobacteria bacterium]|nr:flippase-like domain-containing protein [Acidobacteriota bacterium]